MWNGEAQSGQVPSVCYRECIWAFNCEQSLQGCEEEPIRLGSQEVNLQKLDSPFWSKLRVWIGWTQGYQSLGGRALDSHGSLTLDSSAVLLFRKTPPGSLSPAVGSEILSSWSIWTLASLSITPGYKFLSCKLLKFLMMPHLCKSICNPLVPGHFEETS